MRLPEIELVRHDGACLAPQSLAGEGAVALVFLRHLGCLFCREQVATLRESLPDENIAFICMAEPARAERFRRWMRSPHPFFSDPDRRLYATVGLDRGNVRNLLGPRVAVKAARALLSGARPGSVREDAWQLGGTFVVDRSGTVITAFPAADAGDHPSPEAIRSALAGAAV